MFSVALFECEDISVFLLFQFATVILFIEWRLYHIGLTKLIRPVGVSGKSLNLDEKRRYLRLEERTSHLKPFTYTSKDVEVSEAALKPTVSQIMPHRMSPIDVDSETFM